MTLAKMSGITISEKTPRLGRRRALSIELNRLFDDEAMARVRSAIDDHSEAGAFAETLAEDANVPIEAMTKCLGLMVELEEVRRDRLHDGRWLYMPEIAPKNDSLWAGCAL